MGHPRHDPHRRVESERGHPVPGSPKLSFRVVVMLESQIGAFGIVAIIALVITTTCAWFGLVIHQALNRHTNLRGKTRRMVLVLLFALCAGVAAVALIIFATVFLEIASALLR